MSSNNEAIEALREFQNNFTFGKRIRSVDFYRTAIQKIIDLLESSNVKKD